MEPKGIKLLDELNDILLWESTPVIQAPQGGILKSLADANEAISSEYIDKAVGNTLTADNSTLPSLPIELNTFGSWESVAATIFNHIYKLTKFDPTDDKLDSATFAAFKEKFWSCPYLLKRESVYRDVTLKVTSYMDAVNAISDLIENIVDANSKERIMSSIKKIAQLASENVEHEQKESLFQQGGLSVLKGKMQLLYLSNYVAMKATRGKNSVIDQKTQITRVVGELDVDYCRRHAESLLKYDKESVDEWEKSTGSYPKKENTSPGWNR